MPARASVCLCLVLGACGSSGPAGRYANGTFTRGGRSYQVGFLPESWRRIDVPHGDLAWHEPDHDAVAATTATCQGHRDAPLGVLVNDLLIGTTQRRVLLDETIPFDDREARHNVVEARLDGVPMVYDLYVMKKDGCIYDLIMACPPSSYDAVSGTWVTFVNGFHGGASR
jgi:hypothetical protein